MYVALFILIATVTPFIYIAPRRQAVIQRDTSRLTRGHASHGRCQGCRPCSLAAATLAALKEPHCVCHERSPTVADARPTLRRHVPCLIAPLLFPTNVGVALTPPLSLFSRNTLVGYKARCHMPCLAKVHPVMVTQVMLSHAATFTCQCRRHPHPHPHSRHGSLAARICCRALL